MRMNEQAHGERGIGNFAFIAVLVLFVVALAMWFVAKDEADTNTAKAAKAEAQNKVYRDQLGAAENSYDAMREMWGFGIQELIRKGNTFPDPKVIQASIRTRLTGMASEMESKSETTLSNRVYEITESAIKFTPGDPNKLQLYVNNMTKDTITVAGMLAGIPAQMAAAAKMIRENNDRFETETANDKKFRETMTTSTNTMKSEFAKQKTQLENELGVVQTTKSELENSVSTTSANLDAVSSKLSTVQTDSAKREGILVREKQALQNRLITEKERKEIALAENPVDGVISYSNASKGICYISLGKVNHLSAGTRFSVWKAGKGNRRVDIATIETIRVNDKNAVCRVLRTVDSRLPVAKDHNISNPFYDPKGKVRVFIYGDLTRYPTDVARARLARSGAVVARTLDERVNVIVLGAPPVSGGDGESSDDEAERAAAVRKADAEREKRVRGIVERARALGAVVVSERVLATFMDY